MLDVMEGNICDNNFGPGKDNRKGTVDFHKCLIYISYPLLNMDHLRKHMFTGMLQNSVSSLNAALDYWSSHFSSSQRNFLGAV